MPGTGSFSRRIRLHESICLVVAVLISGENEPVPLLSEFSVRSRRRSGEVLDRLSA